ncbi:hypothetical protein [Nereida sp. MMG025]|uniref:hypothetical protein n=1 Tax=Nereida sp. MMG025 TaxID=2909981 RepID=UPI001F3E758D|nr:hypothetical protein [Nereida sp. MMG025]MCF6445872.1 hypothetical protein [Nereida sp. MMG025]
MSTTASSKSRSNGKSKDKAPDAAAFADKVQDDLDAGIAEVRQTAQAALDQSSEQVARAAQQSSKFVRDNPALAVAGAVGVGLLIGLALRGRS